MTREKGGSKEALEAARQGLKDPRFFCRFFLPTMFPGEIPPFHMGVWAVLLRRTDFLTDPDVNRWLYRNFVVESPDGAGEPERIFDLGPEGELTIRPRRYTLLELPRGFSKTTIAGVAASLYRILYRMTRFSIYVSESATHAEMQLATIKGELAANERIIEVFGDLRPQMKAEERWSASLFQTTTGITMMAKGRGSQIRGSLMKGQRPDTIIFDDLENAEEVENETQRKKDRAWFYGDLMPALPRLDRSATIVGLGTLLHPDSLLKTLERDPQWASVRLGAHDRDGGLLWPAMMDEAEYERTKLSYAAANELSRFYLEYENTVRVEGVNGFRAQDFIYEPAPALDSLSGVAIYGDPAASKRRTADEFVITVWGMGAKGVLWKLDEWAKRGPTPSEFVDAWFSLRARWGRPRLNGIESNGVQGVYGELLREEMFRRGDYFEVIPVSHKAKKEIRIMSVLQPRYRAGYVRHARRFPEYETQLLDYPKVAHDDRADASAACIVLLDPLAGHAAGVDLAEDEAPPLEEVFGGNWRAF